MPDIQFVVTAGTERIEGYARYVLGANPPIGMPNEEQVIGYISAQDTDQAAVLKTFRLLVHFGVVTVVEEPIP